MEILLANPRGFCAGVDRAIEIVERALEIHGAPIYVRHEIVHNRHVVERLRGMGAKALGAGVVQVLGTTAVGAGTAAVSGLPATASFAIGAMVALSSTACVLQVLNARGQVESPYGLWGSLGTIAAHEEIEEALNH